MHYANGRPAQLGDVVKGKGYNVKHEIIGIVVGLTPGTDTCNIKVCCVAKQKDWNSVFTCSDIWMQDGKFAISEAPKVEVQTTIEYGQCDAFLALNAETGEVLLPEAATAPLV